MDFLPFFLALCPLETCIYPVRPIVQFTKFIFSHLVIIGGWGGGGTHKACILNVGQQLMNSIHTPIHILYVPTVTYSFSV